MNRKTFVIASGSFIISKGMHLLINELKNASVVLSGSDLDELYKTINDQQPNYIIICFDFEKNIDFNKIIHVSPDSKLIYLSMEKDIEARSSKYSLSVSLKEDKSSLLNSLTRLMEKDSNIEDSNEETNELSEREKTILKNVAIGLTNKEIADKLFISMHTVITHRKKITRKLGIKTISGLTVYAIINEIVSIEDVEQG